MAERAFSARESGPHAEFTTVPLERTISGTARAENLPWVEVAHAGVTFAWVDSTIYKLGGFGKDDRKTVQRPTTP